ncbi:hypothetical protein ALI22I_09005 [Saccharothrix sp. ALI-22-I]|nr:hypothetical protein ALI22I_09005 [Saccharothrix sp. ALI-22-I]
MMAAGWSPDAAGSATGLPGTEVSAVVAGAGLVALPEEQAVRLPASRTAPMRTVAVVRMLSLRFSRELSVSSGQ